MTLPSMNLDFTRVDSELLDCIDDNIAVLLDHLGVVDIRTPFACEWHFQFSPKAEDSTSSFPVSQRTPIAERVRVTTGCSIITHRFLESDPLPSVEAHLRRGEPLLVYGDAFAMPWLPYAGRERLEHGFVVDGLSADGEWLHVVDAYSNLTEWGAAVPIKTKVDRSTFLSILAALGNENRYRFDTIEASSGRAAYNAASFLRANSDAISRSVGRGRAIAAFSEYHRQRLADVDAIGAFMLATWTLARARKLHGLWLADLARREPALLPESWPARFLAEIAGPWGNLQELAYLLFRRVRRGRSAPSTCFDLLENTLQAAEAEAAAELRIHLDRYLERRKG